MDGRGIWRNPDQVTTDDPEFRPTASRGVPVTPRVPPDVVIFSEPRRAEISDQVRARKLRRGRRGVYVPTANDVDSEAIRREHDALVDIRAVAERLTTDHVFSHTSAALLHGCWIWRLPPEVHVSQAATPKAGKRADPGLRRHRVAIPDAERTVVADLPVTTLERTVVDCASILTPKQGIVIVDSAMRAGADHDEIARVIGTRTHTRGIRRARQVVAMGDATLESPGESILRWIILDAGLPPPTTQIRVETWRGPKWIDLGWPSSRIGLEFDGAVKYGSSSDLVAEKQRHDAIVEAGWELLRVTWPDLEHPASLIRRIRALIQTRTY